MTAVEDLKARPLKFRTPVRRYRRYRSALLFALRFNDALTCSKTSYILKRILAAGDALSLSLFLFFSLARFSPLYAKCAPVGPKSRPHQKFSGAIFRGPAPHPETRLLNNISVNARIRYGPESGVSYTAAASAAAKYLMTTLRPGSWKLYSDDGEKRGCAPQYYYLN